MTTNGGANYNTSGAFPYTLVAKVSDDAGDEIYSTVQSSSLSFALNQDFGPYLVSSGYSELTLGCNGSCPNMIFADLTLALRFIPSAPEPSSWILMTIGFAGLGYVSYRNRESSRSALATIAASRREAPLPLPP
jgi:PEP-CTERM motif